MSPTHEHAGVWSHVAPRDGEKDRKHQGLLGIPGEMPIPCSAVQLPGLHITICLCKIQELWELFDSLLISSNLNEPLSLEQKQGQCLGGYRSLALVE